MIEVTWQNEWSAPGNQTVNVFKSKRAFAKWRNQPRFLNIVILKIESR